MREIRIRAARESRKMKDIIAESLRRDLGIGMERSRSSVREIEPVSVKRMLDFQEPDDRLEDMLDARGHRY